MCDNFRLGNGAFCIDLSKEASGKNFCMHNGALCYFPKKARRRRWVVQPYLRAMLMQYYCSFNTFKFVVLYYMQLCFPVLIFSRWGLAGAGALLNRGGGR